MLSPRASQIYPLIAAALIAIAGTPRAACADEPCQCHASDNGATLYTPPAPYQPLQLAFAFSRTVRETQFLCSVRFSEYVASRNKPRPKPVRVLHEDQLLADLAKAEQAIAADFEFVAPTTEAAPTTKAAPTDVEPTAERPQLPEWPDTTRATYRNVAMRFEDETANSFSGMRFTR